MAAAVEDGIIVGSYRFQKDSLLDRKNLELINEVLKKWLKYTQIEFKSVSFYEKNIFPICQNFKMLLYSKIKTDKKINEISLAEIFKILMLFRKTAIRFEHSQDNLLQNRDFKFLEYIFNVEGFAAFEKAFEEKQIPLDSEMKKNLITISKSLSSEYILKNIVLLIEQMERFDADSGSKNPYADFKYISCSHENKLKAFAIYYFDDENLNIAYLATDSRGFFEKRDVKLSKGAGRSIIEEFVSIALKENKNLRVSALDNIDSFYLHLGFEIQDDFIYMVLTVEKAKKLYLHLLKAA
jgi:hypothetical protein